jgi:hypothetical protein
MIPEINILGALTTRGPTRIGGSSFINGNDTTYAGWNCPPAGPPMPGIAINDSSLITTSGCNNLRCVAGSPQVQETPVAGDTTTYFSYGSTDWDRMVAAANVIMTGGNAVGPTYVNGQCDRSNPNNWGDPNRNPGTPGACESYFPIIYAPNNVHVTGGMGQGILLVDGDLQVSGGFQFYGPVIVRGNLRTTGTGGHFNGGVMAANVDLEQNTVLGNAVVSFSRCALMRASLGASQPAPARERAWADMF